MATPYEDALSGIATPSAPDSGNGYADALAGIMNGDYSQAAPDNTGTDEQDDWWNKYWGHLSDQASSAYHAHSNNEAASMPTTDPMTLTQLIANRAPYLDDIDAASDPNADADQKQRAATAAQRLARIDSVLSLMGDQGPRQPMTTKRADEVVQALTHAQLMSSDRYRQVYDSTSTDMMDENARRDYARDVIAKEVSDLPYQRESILAQIAGQNPDKAIEMYGLQSPAAQRDEFYRHHGADVPLPSSIAPETPESMPTPDAESFDKVAELERVGVERAAAGLHGVAAATNVLTMMPAAALYDALASQFGGDPTAAQDWVGKNLVDPASHEAEELRRGAVPKTVAEKVVGMAGDLAAPFALMLVTRNPEAAQLALPADLTTLENASAQFTAQLPGAATVALPTTTEAAIEKTQAGEAPSTGEFLGELGQSTLMNAAPMAASGPLGARAVQGAAAQTALGASQSVAAGEVPDVGDLAAQAIVGAGFGAAHVAPGHEVQKPADVAAAREGFRSAEELRNVTAAHAKWEDRFAKVLEQIGDDPEAKARADYALSQFNDGHRNGLWAMSELKHIAETGKTRDEEAYAAAQAAVSPEATVMGVTPESDAAERASETQAASDVFGDEQTYAAEQGMTEQRADDSLPQTEGIEPTDVRYNVGAKKETPAEPEELSVSEITPEERASFERQRRAGTVEQPQGVNASGESAASAEAISRVRQEKVSGQHRALIERDGTVRPLIGVDAVDTHARPGQVIVQRGVGRNEWTILSHGADLTTDVAHGRVNAARGSLDDIVKENEPRYRLGREGNSEEVGGTERVGESAVVPTAETAAPRASAEVVGEERPSRVSETADIDSAAHAAETSPLTEGQPSESKIAAGNYRKGHIKAQGLDISIENPRGSTRSGVSPDGRSWSRTMNHHYGYIKGTLGADGDHLDVLLGDQPNNPGRQVFVVDQQKPGGGFDEHKVLLGFRNQRAAEQAYLSEYPKGWQGMGRVRAMSIPEFKTWTRGQGRDEAITGPVADNVPRVMLRHQQPDASTVHASAPVEGSSVVAGNSGFDGRPLARLSLDNASMPSRRRAVMNEVPRGATVPEGHSSAVLRNVYDLGRDPRGLMQRAREEVQKRGLPMDEDHVINEFERQVVAHGYDGYRSEGHVAVLGHDVPVAKPEEGETHETARSAEPAPTEGEGAADVRYSVERPGDAGSEGEGGERDQGASPDVSHQESADERESAPRPAKVKYAGKGMSRSAAQGLVRLLKWEGARGLVEVHQTEGDLPAHLRDNIPDGYQGRVHGLYDPRTGKVHIVADQMDSPKELYRTLTEEHLGHGGLRKVFNKADLNKFLDRAWSSIPKDERVALAKQYGLNLSLPEGRRIAAEEYLAKLDPAALRNKSLFEKFHDWFNETSRKMGREVDYSPSELRAVMAVAHDHQRAGLSPSHGSRSPVDNVTPRFNLDGTKRISDETFYSALARTVENAKDMPRKADPKAWKEWFDGAQRRGLFKKAERDWMGIDQFLGRAKAADDLFGSKEAITRDEVQQFVRSHQVQLGETMLRAPSVSGHDLTTAEADLEHARMYAEDENDVDFYREQLNDLERRSEAEAKTKTHYDEYTLPGGSDYRELLIQIPSFDNPNIEGFQSSHWKVPNIVAHVRMKQRYGQFGTKVLHLEELQSDWHQEGRKKGYRGSPDEQSRAEKELFSAQTKAASLAEQLTPLATSSTLSSTLSTWSGSRRLQYLMDMPRENYDSRFSNDADVLDKVHEAVKAYEMAGEHADVVSRGIANAPFKREWPMLAFKRALRYAAENNFDRISWTKGFQQAERYDLSRYVSGIDVFHYPDEQRFRVRINRHDSDGDEDFINLFTDESGKVTQASDHFPGRNLSDVVGEEVARKILSVRDSESIDGGDLRLGGEGMAKFYDEMLPNEIGKYVKQWGGKVVDHQRVTSVGEHNRPGRDEFERDVPTPEEGFGPYQAHSVDITPQMRESVLAGQPMFRLKRAKADDDTEASMAKTMSKPLEDMTLGDRARAWLDDLKAGSMREGWESFKQGMIDSGNQVARIEREIFGGFLADASESPYKMYNLAKNSHAVMAAVMKLGVPQYRDGAFQPVDGRKGIFEVFRPLFEHESGESLLPLWEFYAAGLRASRLIKETNINGTLREKNFTQDDIDRALALADKYPVFKRVAADFQTFNNQLLDLAVDRGALGAEEAEAWKGNFYVPFYRAMEEMEFGGSSKVAKTRKGSAASNQRIWSRRLTGQEAKVDSVFENILANTSYILDRTYRQEFMNRLLDMGEGVVLQKVQMANKAISVSVGDMARSLSKLGLHAGPATHGRFGSPNIQPSPHWSTVEIENLTPAEKQQWTRVFQRVAPTDPDIVPIMRDGKLSYYRVSDPLLLRTIGAMGHDSFGNVISFLSGGKRMVTWGVTKDPGFMVATWFRDALINWVGSHTPITPFVDSAKGALASVRDDPLVSRLMMAGVGVAPHYETQGGAVRGQIERMYGPTTVLGTARSFLDFYNRLGFAAEASSRLAIADQALKRGASMAEAAYQAQDILNYSMRGDYTAARVLAATAPFWNAGMQGLYRFIRGAGMANAMAGDTSQLRSYMLRGSVLLAATLGNMWRNQDDPRYQRLSNDEKDRYWWFFIGDQKWKLPKPFEAGVIFGTIPERIVQRWLGNDTTKDTAHAMLRAVMEEMRLNPFPQYVRQGIEQWSNRETSSGNPIVPGSLQDQLPQDQYSPFTHISARAIANTVPEKMPWLNSPKRVESLVRGLTGTLGTYALNAGDWLARASGLAPPAPSTRLQDIPVISRFYGGDSATGDRSQYEDKLYDMNQTARETFNSFEQAAKEGNQARVQELAQRPAFQYHGALDSMARSVTALRSTEKQIMQNPFLTPEQKRQQLDAASAARIKLLDQYAPFLDKLYDQF